MIGNLIKKEIRSNLFSFRFFVAFILLLFVIPITIFILGDDYVRQVNEFSQRQSDLEDYLKNYAHFNRIGGVLRPFPQPIAFHALVRGLSSDTNLTDFDNDPLPVMFPLIDLTLIITVFLSLIALLFSYDAVSGEKEDGTLKLILSNEISRAKLILAKVIGGSVSLMLPFLFSLLVGMILLLFNPRIQWTGTDWGAFGLIIIGSFLYFSLFYCLGLFISSRHHSSSASIMTSLFIWVLFVLVIPNLSPYVASVFSKTPSRIKINRQVDRIRSEERDELGRQLATERQASVFKIYPFLEEPLSEEQRNRRIEEDPEYKQAYQELSNETSAAWSEANRIQGEKAKVIQKELELKEQAQTRLSYVLSMISPLSDMVYLVTDLSSTGTRNLRHFGRITEAWYRSFGDYTRKRLAALRQKNPAIDWWNVPVDMSDRPVFLYRQENLLDRFKGTLPYFLIITIFNLVFFTAAFFSFVRYDVR